MLPLERFSRFADLLHHPVSVAFLDHALDARIRMVGDRSEAVAPLQDHSILGGTHLHLLETALTVALAVKPLDGLDLVHLRPALNSLVHVAEDSFVAGGPLGEVHLAVLPASARKISPDRGSAGAAQESCPISIPVAGFACRSRLSPMLGGVPRGDNAQTVRATLALRQLLFDGDIPAGERLVELALVERIGVSRTPLRLALTRLEHEGLVESLPGGGFAVRTFARADIDDAIELRGVVEGAAARFAAERLESPSQLQSILGILDDLEHVVHERTPDTVPSYVELNEAYHAALVDLAGSETLSRELARINALPFVSPGALLASYAQLEKQRELFLIAQHQHRTIVEAIRAGQGTRAEEITREHARMTQTFLGLALASRETRDAVPGLSLLGV